MSSRQATDEARACRDILASIVAGAELEAILVSVAREAARLCRSSMAGITLLTENGDELELVALSGAHAPLIRRRFAVADSLNGIVINSGRSLRSGDLSRERRRLPAKISQRNDVRALLIVPCPGAGKPLGTLMLAARKPRRFTARHEAVLARLARCASIAIQHAAFRRNGRAARGFARPATAETVDFNGRREGKASTRDAASSGLTPREREIMGLLAADKSCKEVASILNISNRTLEHHIERLKLRFHKSTLHGLVNDHGRRQG